MAKFKTLNVDAGERRKLTGEEELWVAVLSRAAEDAFLMKCNTLTTVGEAEQALIWFKKPSQDFAEVCGYAGRDPTYVYEQTVLKSEQKIKEREIYLEIKRKALAEELEQKRLAKHNKKYGTYFTCMEAMQEHIIAKREA